MLEPALLSSCCFYWFVRSLITEGNEDGIQTSLSLQDQYKLIIPNGMWQLILSVPGWFPVV